MKSPQSTPAATVDAGRVRQVLRQGRRGLVAEVTAALAREIEMYGTFPEEVLAGDIAATVRNNIDLFLAALSADELPSAEAYSAVRVSAARRAEERVPLELVIRAYPIAARVIVERIGDEAGAEDALLPAGLVCRILDYLRDATTAAVGGYLEELQLIQGAGQSAREQLLDALRSGTYRAESFDHAAFDMPAAFTVLALRIDDHPDELLADVDARMAARRKLRRVRTALQRAAGDEHLASLMPGGGLVLLPAASADAGHRSSDETAALVRSLTEAAQAPVTAAVRGATPGEVPAAITIAIDVLDVVRITGRPPGVYGLADVSYEYQATRPGPARDALAAQLAAVDTEPDLVATLRTFLTTGGNRLRTARLLGIHHNTVDNRMRKLARLTHLDPVHPDDATRLRMALLAHDAQA